MKRDAVPAALWLPPDAPAVLADELAVHCLDTHGSHTVQWDMARQRLQGSRVVLVLPQEQVAFHTVSVPPARRALQQQALAFALEPQLVQPLDAVHVASRAQASPGQWQVAVVDRALLEGWCGQLRAAGIAVVAIHVDADLLPGTGLRGLCLPRRCLLADDAGLRLAVPALHWPQLQPRLPGALQWLPGSDLTTASPLSGDGLPDTASSLLADGATPLPMPSEPADWLPQLLAQRAQALDLAQGPFALARPAASARRWRPLGWALAAALVLHLGGMAAQGAVYARQAMFYDQANRALFAAAAGPVRVVDMQVQFDQLRARQLGVFDLLATLERVNAQQALPLAGLAWRSDQRHVQLQPAQPDAAVAADVAAALSAAGVPSRASAEGWPLLVEVAQ